MSAATLLGDETRCHRHHQASFGSLLIVNPRTALRRIGRKITLDLHVTAQGKEYAEKQSARRRTLLLQEVFLGRFIREITMIRFVAFAFALAVATSAQAISPHSFISRTA